MMKNKFKYLFPLVLILHSCTRTVYTGTVEDSTYLGRLPFVLKDNSTFSVYYGCLQSSTYLDSISDAGPYTVFAANNDGLAPLAPPFGAPVTPASVTSAIGGPTVLPQYMSYTLTRGQHALRSMPLGDNQPLMTFTGQTVYVTRYLSNGDTLTEVNGQPVISLDEPATNGLLEVMDGFLQPQLYRTVLDRIESDSNYAYFAAALQRTHLDTLLAGNGIYTILVPGNYAFRSSAGLGINISSIDSILTADPVRLANIIGYHILPGRYFLNDFSRMATADSLTLTMYNGETVKYTLGPNFPPAPVWSGALFSGNGISTGYNGVAFSLSDWPAGNGVVHSLGTVLVP